MSFAACFSQRPQLGVFDGDSITKGSAAWITIGLNDYPTQLAAMLSPRPLLKNIAVGGSHGGHAGFDTIPPLGFPVGRRFYVLLTGLNGLATTLNAAQQYTEITDQIALVVASGFAPEHIALSTVFSSTLLSSDQNAQRLILNDMIHANGRAVVPFARNADMENVANFPDGRHPAPYGTGSCTTMAQIARPIVQNLMRL